MPARPRTIAECQFCAKNIIRLLQSVKIPAAYCYSESFPVSCDKEIKSTGNLNPVAPYFTPDDDERAAFPQPPVALHRPNFVLNN
jgi:hypothetical protein